MNPVVLVCGVLTVNQTFMQAILFVEEQRPYIAGHKGLLEKVFSRAAQICLVYKTLQKKNAHLLAGSGVRGGHEVTDDGLRESAGRPPEPGAGARAGPALPCCHLTCPAGFRSHRQSACC